MTKYACKIIAEPWMAGNLGSPSLSKHKGQSPHRHIAITKGLTMMIMAWLDSVLWTIGRGQHPALTRCHCSCHVMYDLSNWVWCSVHNFVPKGQCLLGGETGTGCMCPPIMVALKGHYKVNLQSPVWTLNPHSMPLCNCMILNVNEYLSDFRSNRISWNER